MVTFATNHSAAVRSRGGHVNGSLIPGDLGVLFNATDSSDIRYNPVYDMGCVDDSPNKSETHLISPFAFQ